MARSNIHVIQAGDKDWGVKEEGGREYGHYANQHEAAKVREKLARHRKAELLLRDRNGKLHRSNFSCGWFAWLFGR